MSRDHDSSASRLSRRLRLLCLVFAAWTGTASAQTYLILSLVGDRLTIITTQKQVGSNIDRNQQEVHQLNDHRLDDFAVRVADAAIAKARPAASVTMLRATDPALYALRNSWLDADAIEVQSLVSVIANLFPPSSDSHLVLIAPTVVSWS